MSRDAGPAGTDAGSGPDPAGPAPLPLCYTPQQVRFTDRRGVLWTVRCAHRPAEGEPPPLPGALPIIDDEGSRIAACREGRCWLEFSAGRERRRLRLVPPRWYTLSPTALAVLCEEAER